MSKQFLHCFCEAFLGYILSRVQHHSRSHRFSLSGNTMCNSPYVLLCPPMSSSPAWASTSSFCFSCNSYIHCSTYTSQGTSHLIKSGFLLLNPKNCVKQSNITSMMQVFGMNILRQGKLPPPTATYLAFHPVWLIQLCMWSLKRFLNLSQNLALQLQSLEKNIDMWAPENYGLQVACHEWLVNAKQALCFASRCAASMSCLAFFPFPASVPMQIELWSNTLRPLNASLLARNLLCDFFHVFPASLFHLLHFLRMHRLQARRIARHRWTNLRIQ